MALQDRLVRFLGRFGPFVGGTILVFVVLVLFWPLLEPLASDGATVAWVVGILAMVYALGHLTIRVHARRGAALIRDERGELTFRLDALEEPPRESPSAVGHPHGAHSHSGERPRFD
jgi:hypothetical protein